MKKASCGLIFLLVAQASSAAVGTPWQPLGHRGFEGRHDSEFILARRGGVADVGLEPSSPARCTSVAASFGDGDMETLDLDPRAVLPPGRLSVIALPGGVHYLRSVDMHCRSVDGRSLTVRLFVQQVAPS